MQLKSIATSLLGLTLCVPVWTQDKPKLAELNTDSVQFGVISVDGFWEPDNPTKQNEVIPTAVHIECFRHGGKEANLVKTEAFCIVATATAQYILRADFSFVEASWSDDEVVISDDSPTCITSKTFFDLKRRTVTGLDIRKPEAKGFSPLLDCKLLPDRQSYYLRDRDDYAFHHEPVKK